MNNIIKRKWNQNSMVIIEDLHGMAFQAESGGHTFQISGIDGEGNVVALSGTPAGVMLRADGQDVLLNCSVSSGVVYATLPANAYSVPGRFGLTIFLTSDGQKTAIYAAVGTVGKTSSGTVAPPAGSDVVTLVNAIAAAVATIPASYTDLMAAMAPTYSSSGLYAVGSYAWYSGKLYRCTTAITSGETWTSGHWTLANLGSDLVDLKSAIDNTTKNASVGIANIFPGFTNGQNLLLATGEIDSTPNPYRKTSGYFIAESDVSCVFSSGLIRICRYDKTTGTYLDGRDTGGSPATLAAGSKYRFSADVGAVIEITYKTSLYGLANTVEQNESMVLERTNMLSENIPDGKSNVFTDYLTGKNLLLTTGEIDTTPNAGRKTSGYLQASKNILCAFSSGTLRICKYNKTTGVYDSGRDTSASPATLESGYKYRISADVGATVELYFVNALDGITGMMSKNISPTEKIVPLTGGYINGSCGMLGNVTNGKTYTISGFAYIRSAATSASNLQIRVTPGSGYSVVGTIAAKNFDRSKKVYFSLTFTTDTTGDVYISASGYSDDVGYDMLYNLQLEEGNVATPYVKHDGQTANDYIARADITQWKRRKSIPIKSFILSVAHQGYDGYGANKNTLQAFIDAQIAGFDMIETDVLMTSDRVPVLSHDGTRTTTGGTTVDISSVTFEQLQSYQFYSDASIKIPSLWEGLDICNQYGIGMMIELKAADLTEAEIKEIVNESKRSFIKIIFVSFHSAMLGLVRTVDPKTTIGLNLPTTPSISDLEESEAYSFLRSMLEMEGKTAFSCDVSNVDSDWFDSVLKLGYNITLDAANSTVTRDNIKHALGVVSNTNTVEEYLFGVAN